MRRMAENKPIPTTKKKLSCLYSRQLFRTQFPRQASEVPAASAPASCWRWPAGCRTHFRSSASWPWCGWCATGWTEEWSCCWIRTAPPRWAGTPRCWAPARLRRISRRTPPAPARSPSAWSPGSSPGTTGSPSCSPRRTSSVAESVTNVRFLFQRIVLEGCKIFLYETVFLLTPSCTMGLSKITLNQTPARSTFFRNLMVPSQRSNSTWVGFISSKSGHGLFCPLTNSTISNTSARIRSGCIYKQKLRSEHHLIIAV